VRSARRDLAQSAEKAGFVAVLIGVQGAGYNA